jgi:hypothetical protein
MAFWKKNDAAESAGSAGEYDILNDFRALERELRQSGQMGGKPDSATTRCFLHLYRQEVWGGGEHPPMPYPIELEPPIAS